MQIVCLCCARLPFCVHQTQDQTIMQQSPTYTLFLYQFNKSKSKINKIVLSVWIFALFFIYLSVCCAGAHFAHEVNTRRASRTQAEGVVWWNDWWSRTLSRAERRRTREEIATYAPEYAFSANESNIRQSITAKNTASSDSHSKAFYLMLRIERCLRIHICLRSITCTKLEEQVLSHFFPPLGFSWTAGCEFENNNFNSKTKNVHRLV